MESLIAFITAELTHEVELSSDSEEREKLRDCLEAIRTIGNFEEVGTVANANEKIYHHIKQVRHLFPFDEFARMAMWSMNVDSIYQVFCAFDIASEVFGTIEECTEFEKPNEELALHIFLAAIDAEKNHVAETVRNLFPSITGTNAAFRDIQQSKRILSYFPDIAHDNNLVIRLTANGRDECILLKASIQNVAQRQNNPGIENFHLARFLNRFKENDGEIGHCFFHHVSKVLVNDGYNYERIVFHSGILKRALQVEDIELLRIFLSYCPSDLVLNRVFSLFSFVQPQAALVPSREMDRREHFLQHVEKRFEVVERAKLLTPASEVLEWMLCVFQENVKGVFGQIQPSDTALGLFGIGLPIQCQKMFMELKFTLRQQLLLFAQTPDDMVDTVVRFVELCQGPFPLLRQNMLSEWIVSEKRIIPVKMMKQIAKLLQIHTCQVDSNGRIPLITFLTSANVLRSTGMYEIDSILSFLLGDNAAKKRSNDGRLPLHFACDIGLLWSQGLEQIHHAYPNIATDPYTGLCPFALSAASDSPSINKDPDLNAIFSLLRHNPAAIFMERRA